MFSVTFVGLSRNEKGPKHVRLYLAQLAIGLDRFFIVTLVIKRSGEVEVE
jgi:hypothetical protein